MYNSVNDESRQTVLTHSSLLQEVTWQLKYSGYSINNVLVTGSIICTTKVLNFWPPKPKKSSITVQKSIKPGKNCFFVVILCNNVNCGWEFPLIIVATCHLCHCVIWLNLHMHHDFMFAMSAPVQTRRANILSVFWLLFFGEHWFLQQEPP